MYAIQIDGVYYAFFRDEEKAEQELEAACGILADTHDVKLCQPASVLLYDRLGPLTLKYGATMLAVTAQNQPVKRPTTTVVVD